MTDSDLKEHRQFIMNAEQSIRMANKEVMNPMVAFAQAWSGLGDAIQEQMIDLINAHVEGRLEDAAYEINPNAFDRAAQRLTSPLRMMDGEDADDLKDMMEQVQAMMREMR